MPLNIKDSVTEKLAAEVASLTGETKTGAIRQALLERKERLAYRVARRDRQRALLEFLEVEVWPEVPVSARGRRMSCAERERILGFGKSGV